MERDAGATEPLLWRVAGEAMAAIFRDGPGFAAALTDDSWLVVGGEPQPVFNWLAIHGSGRHAEGRLREGVATLRGRGLPGLVALAEGLAAGLAPVAEGLGLENPHPVPLMVRRPAAPPAGPLAPGLVVEAVRDEAGLRTAGGLVSAAFGLAPESVARCCGASLLAAPALSLYLARAAEEPFSTCWVWQAGSLAYVVMMATAPEHQRRGAGRTLLAHALAEHAAAGATTAHLLASAAGRPLYERLGFRTEDAAVAWVVPPPPGSEESISA